MSSSELVIVVVWTLCLAGVILASWRGDREDDEDEEAREDDPSNRSN